MALQGSGQIKLSEIAGEFGGSAPHQMSEYYSGGSNTPSGTGSVPTSGEIQASDFYGTSNISYIGASGGNSTYNSGDYTYRKFTGSGTLAVSALGTTGNNSIEYLIVAGGGAGPNTAGGQSSGGGGGAGAGGGNGVNPGVGGDGGAGVYLADDFIGPTAPSYGTPGPVGSSRYFAGGGGGATANVPAPSVGQPGAGGGGKGGLFPSSSGTGGTINTGGGAGGNNNTGGSSVGGGSGIVIIRYKFQ